MSPYTIIMGHNYYRRHGGEDESFHSEVSMLKQRGHNVLEFIRRNESINELGIQNRIRLFSQTIWSGDSYAEISSLINTHIPTLVHFQNTLPLISPSVFYACKKNGIPVVQTLRNYRLICANGLFFRSGHVCEDCFGKAFPWPGILHGCYRKSRLQTTAVATMLYYHNLKNTWDSQVDAYIALSEFSRKKFIDSGLEPAKVHVKPNYIDDPGIGNQSGDYVMYAGRLSEEKGVRILLEAFTNLKEINLVIIGDGPIASYTEKYIAENGIKAKLMGLLPKQAVIERLKLARCLIYPSTIYETFGRTIIEAFACGIPVIVSRLGAMAELVQEGVTGLLFNPGDADDLATKIEWLWDNPRQAASMGASARREYEQKYTPERNYQMLMKIYQSILPG